MKLTRTLLLPLLTLAPVATPAAQSVAQIIGAAGDGTGNILDAPTDTAIDATGNVYVNGGGSSNVFKITPAGVVSQIIDSTGDGAGNVLTNAASLATDSAGNVYVTGAGSDNAFKITPGGVITEIIDATGDGAGNAFAAGRGIAVDAFGNVYVTAQNSSNAFKITPGGVITEIIDSTGDGTGNGLNTCIGVAVDSVGNVYVVGKFSNNIFKITPGGVITQVMSLGGPEQDIAVDAADNVYVTSANSAEAFRISPGGTITTLIDSSGDGLGNTLAFPTGIDVDAAGNVYVAGFVSSNVFKITAGGVITQIIDSAGDGTNPLTNAYGLEVDAFGTVYVSGTNSDSVHRISNPTGRCDVILADLTGDGVLDAATVDVGPHNVTLFAGDGLGNFDTGTITALTVGDGAVALVAGNLVAGDGTDLAVAARDADAVRILSNAPEGTLSVSATVDMSSIGANPAAVAAGDVDGSGLDDLAIALQGEILISGLSGVALSLDGGAPAMLTAPPGGYGEVNGVEICDLDGDGDLDVIASMGSSLFVSGVKEVLLYENTGAGVFGAPVVLTMTEEPRSFCCSDIDGDGDADLLITTQDLLTPGAVELLLNDGLAAGSWSAGDFSSGGTYPGGDSAFDIACADLDDENIEGFFYRNDVVTVNVGSGDLTRHDGFIDSGSGFEATTTLSAGSVPVALDIADLNGDKTPDIVVANKATADLTVSVANPLAQSQTFGAGCAGTGGLVPMIGVTNLPVAGSSNFSIELTNARASSLALLGFSFSLTPVTISGCDLYVPFDIVFGPFLTDGAGAFSLSIPVPPLDLFGCDIFAQWGVIDPNGTLVGRFALSEGLRNKIAN